MPIMGMHQKLLPMACLRKDQQEVLAKVQSIRKRGGPQDQKKPVVELQTLKGVIKWHLNLWAKWQNQKFKALVNSKATKNHISPAAIKKMGLPHRQKKNPYLLVIISGDPILYRDSMIHFKIEPVKIKVEG